MAIKRHNISNLLNKRDKKLLKFVSTSAFAKEINKFGNRLANTDRIDKLFENWSLSDGFCRIENNTLYYFSNNGMAVVYLDTFLTSGFVFIDSRFNMYCLDDWVTTDSFYKIVSNTLNERAKTKRESISGCVLRILYKNSPSYYESIYIHKDMLTDYVKMDKSSCRIPYCKGVTWSIDFSKAQNLGMTYAVKKDYDSGNLNMHLYCTDSINMLIPPVYNKVIS